MHAHTLSAHAKINLHLGIHPGRDERGYHRADSLMASVGLADEVRIVRTPEAGPRLEMDADCGVPMERNTAYRALVSLCEALGHDDGYRVEIRKRIPAQSGMGGASSDAAAVLRGLCQLWGVDPRDSRVVEVARGIGADVPFFLEGRPTLLVGAGDVAAETFEPLTGVPVVLVRPNAGVSTPEAYAEFDAVPTEPASPEPMVRALRAGDADALTELLYNNLEPAAERLCPVCREVREWLAARPGVRGARMTGSGSCVYGLCTSALDARHAADAAEAHGWWSCATELR